ncbi:MAG: alpha/beta hydrolase [Ignavibacteriaceae bacterium]|nr:alpha/beta hydrolase [Ignavibacteriaceae bacterium]
MKFWKTLLMINIFCLLTQSYAQKIHNQQFTYSIKDSIELKAYVFTLDSLRKSENLPAIVIFHGGGWSSGEVSWSFRRAEHFAKLGFVAVAAQYRLSDQKNITPVEAMEDARDIIKWMRLNKDLIKINPNKLVGYGWSAGAHLVTSAAIFKDSNTSVSSSPNALVLVSPAVSLGKDTWFQKLLLNRVEANKVSPDENVKKGLPPTLILQGRDDTVTPLSGAQNFTNKMKLNGNICELIIYDGVGHLFTPSSERDDGFPNPDPKVQEKAYKKVAEFLRSLDYIN